MEADSNPKDPDEKVISESKKPRSRNPLRRSCSTVLGLFIGLFVLVIVLLALVNPSGLINWLMPPFYWTSPQLLLPDVDNRWDGYTPIVISDVNFILQGKLKGGNNPQDLYLKILVDGQETEFGRIFDFTFERPLTLSEGEHAVEVRLISRWMGQNITLKKSYFRINQTNTTPIPPVIVGLEKTGEMYHVAGYARPASSIYWDPVVISVQQVSAGSLRTQYSTDNFGDITTAKSGPTGRFDLWFTLVSDSHLQVYLSNVKDKLSPKEATLIDLEHPRNWSEDPQARKNQAIIDLQFLIDPGRITKTLTLQLDSQNEELNKFLDGKTQASEFIDGFLGSVDENGHGSSYDFNNLPPEITIKDGLATLTFRDRTSVVGQINMVGESQVYFNLLQGFPLLGHSGSVTVKINKMDVVQFSPVPNTLAETSYSWKNLKPDQSIVFKLMRSPTDFISSLPTLRIYDFYNIPYWLGQLLQLISDIALAAPILWVIALLVQSIRLRIIDPHAIDWFGMVLSISLLLVLFSTCWYLLNSLAIPLSNLSQFSIPYIRYDPWHTILAPFYSSQIILLAIIVLTFIIGAISAAVSYRNQQYAAWVIWSSVYRASLIFGLIYILNKLINIGYSLIPIYLPDLDISLYFPSWCISALFVYGVISYLWHLLTTYPVEEMPRPIIPYSKLILMTGAILMTIPNAFSPQFQNMNNTRDLENNILYMFDTLSRSGFFFGFLGVVALFHMVSNSFIRGYPQSDIRTKVLQVNGFLSGYIGQERLYLLVNQVVFAGFMIGAQDQWLFVPISFLFAILLFRYLIRPASETVPLFHMADRIREHREELIANIAKSIAFDRLQGNQEDLLVRLSTGKISPSEYEKQKNETQKEQDQIQPDPKLNFGFSVDECTFAIGPLPTPRENTLLAMKWGLILTIPLVVLYIIVYLQNIYPEHPFFWLAQIVLFVSFLMRWLIISFFYGATYEYIRGNNGLKKALFLTGFIAAATLPYKLFTMTSLNGLSSWILEASQIAYFLIGLGLIFTWEILRKNGYSIRYLRLVISDIPSLVTTGSLIATTIGAIILSQFQGQLTTVLTMVMKMVLPNLNTP